MPHMLRALTDCRRAREIADGRLGLDPRRSAEAAAAVACAPPQWHGLIALLVASHTDPVVRIVVSRSPDICVPTCGTSTAWP